MNIRKKAKNPLRARLGELRQELTKGQHHLDLLNQQREQVRDTLLRITGAISMLEELLQEPRRNGVGTDAAPDTRSTCVASVPA